MISLPVVDEVTWCLLLSKLHAHVSGQLGDPSGIRVRRGGQNPHAPAANIDEYEQVHIDQPVECPSFLGHKVALPERVGVDFEKFILGSLAAFGTGIEAMLLKDVLYCLAGDLAATEFFEFSQNASVPTLFRSPVSPPSRGCHPAFAVDPACARTYRPLASSPPR
jgi:hypothetical protein